MFKTAEGKWVLFDLETGEQREFWPIDARALLKAGSHAADPPEGVEAVPPVQPPKHVGAPKAAVANVHEVVPASEPEPDAVPAAEAAEEKPGRAKKAPKKDG
jgi:hypothetical protein